MSPAVHVYHLTLEQLNLTAESGPTLDAVSLQLPAGVYTTLRTYDQNKIVGLGAHLQRLADSGVIAHSSRAIDLAAIRSALRQVIDRERLSTARIRITVPFDRDEILISVEPFDTYPPQFYERGVCCATTCLTRAVPQAKLTDFIAPSRAAKAHGDPQIHELLMVDTAGTILEGISSNFFAVIDATLHTAAENVLAGVTRSIVLAEAVDLVPIDYSPIRVSDLPRVNEAFITSSSREVMPVNQIDHRVIGSGLPGPIARALLGRYRAYLARTAEVP